MSILIVKTKIVKAKRCALAIGAFALLGLIHNSFAEQSSKENSVQKTIRIRPGESTPSESTPGESTKVYTNNDRKTYAHNGKVKTSRRSSCRSGGRCYGGGWYNGYGSYGGYYGPAWGYRPYYYSPYYDPYYYGPYGYDSYYYGDGKAVAAGALLGAFGALAISGSRSHRRRYN